MRALLALAVTSLLLAGVSQASVVVHGAVSGIVATCGDGWALDKYNHAWALNYPSGWDRRPEYDPPVPLEQIRFWEASRFITMSDEYWYGSGTQWINYGQWPASGVEGGPEPTITTALAMPNPSPGSCRISFQQQSDGPANVQLFDTSGRLVRQLLSGTFPAGEYSPTWNGKDDAGKDAPSGVYLTRIGTSAGVTTGRVVLAR